MLFSYFKIYKNAFTLSHQRMRSLSIVNVLWALVELCCLDWLEHTHRVNSFLWEIYQSRCTLIQTALSLIQDFEFISTWGRLVQVNK